MIKFNLVFCLMLLCSTNLIAQLTDFQHIDFKKADSVATLFPDHSIADLRKLSLKLTQPFSTEPEKFRAVYSWVCNNVENDYEFYVKNKKKREQLKDKPDELAQWNRSFAPRVFQKLSKEHRTVCTGYAYLVKELAYHAGINCKIIDGYGRTAQANVGGPGIVNHSWNAVQLDKKWYLCDATWSSGSIDMAKGSFVKQYDEVYYLPDPSFFARNHYPSDTSWLLLEQKTTLEEYLNAPLVYKDALKDKIFPLYPATFNVSTKKGELLTFRFHKGSDEAIEEVELQIIQGGDGNSVYRKIKKDDRGLYVENVFTDRGTFVVHVLHRNKYLFTYTVKVSNEKQH